MACQAQNQIDYKGDDAGPWTSRGKNKIDYDYEHELTLEFPGIVLELLSILSGW